MTVSDGSRQEWDRRQQGDVVDELKLLRGVLEDVRSEVQITNGRVSTLEKMTAAHHSMLYGNPTDLNGDAGVVGMLRQLRKGQQATIAILSAVAVPAALTVLATYLPMLFQ